MDFLKYFNEDAREPSMVDGRGIAQCMQELLNRKVEFKLKVDKAHTVPYTVQVESIGKDTCILAFQRALPPELLKGALFVGGFNMEGNAFETRMQFQERTAYLRYRFSMPERISKMERRAHTRLPFRPREKAHVTLRDGGIPGLGVSGSLLNVSSEGLAMRVDRIIRLDTGLRLSVNSSHFPPKKFFSSVRLEELPGIQVLDLRGITVHATEKSGILMLGLELQSPSADATRQLEDMLRLRTKLLTAKAPSSPGPSAGAPAPKGLPAPAAAAPRPLTVDAPASWDDPDVLNEGIPEDIPEDPGAQDPLLILQRRTLPLLILAPDEERGAQVAALLRERGFRRLAFTLQAATAPAGTVLVDAHPGANAEDGRIPAAEEGWETVGLKALDALAQARV